MDLRLAGKRALITGASRGLGRAVTLRLADEGCDVFAVARASDALEELGRSLEATRGVHSIHACDLMAPGAPEALITERIGQDERIDIIIHNLGGSLRVTDPLAPAEDYARVWRLNVGVPIALNALLLPRMLERGFGRAVHVSSISASNHTGHVAYVSAKAALNGYVAALGRSLAAHDVVINAIEPGPIAMPGRYLTQLQERGGPAWDEYQRNHLPIGRLATPDDLAPFVALLCSPLASYATGAVINVDGGSA
jgi:3-oxoacyl-[acyl-carrier protein] reductase